MRLPHLPRPRLTYANVTSTLALFLVLSTGGAYAAATIGSSQIKDNAIRTQHIAGGQVQQPDLGAGAVSRSKIGDGVVSRAKLGTDVAVARAYGTVYYTGDSVSPAYNFGAATVTHPATGVYCIEGLPFTPSLAVANSTLAWNAGHHDIEIYRIGSGSAPCPTTTQVQVLVFDPGTTTAADGNFNIVIY